MLVLGAALVAGLAVAAAFAHAARLVASADVERIARGRRLPRRGTLGCALLLIALEVALEASKAAAR
jgi:hypothetical protein